MPQNIEIKVACTDQQCDAIRARLTSRAPVSTEELTHIDTYFLVPHGRLKLREIASRAGQAAELIQYRRPDQEGARTSTYRRVPIDLAHVPDLRAGLAEALQVLVTVRKRRMVAIWQSTRIHLDYVESLGQFVELETVLGGSEKGIVQGRAEFDSVVDWLGLASLESIPGSYSDLMIAKGISLK